jgi:transcription elongation GreA/GreB family factor
MSADLSTEIAAGQLDLVEEAWLARLEQDPGDLPFFLGTARALREAGHADEAAVLLQMLEEGLRQGGRWRERLEVLRFAGEVFHDEAERLHGDILRTLGKRYGSSELFAKLSDKVGLHRATDDIPKTWDKVDRLEELLSLAPGTVVWMEGKGVGRVADVNLQLDAFRVALPGMGTLSVGFAAAKKMLRPLPEGHFQRRKLEEPETLAALKRDRPEELVRLVLEGTGEALTGTELRQALAGIVGDGEWTAFWNRARKSAHVVSLSGARQRYRWADTLAGAVAGVRERFLAAPLREQLELLRRDGARDPALRTEMLAALASEVETLRGRDPAGAFEAAMALERAGSAPPVDPAALLAESEDPVRLVSALSDRALREEAYRRLPAARPDWPAAFARALQREEEPKVLDLLADRLLAESGDSLDRVFADLLSQPRKAPATFTWMAERATREEAWLQRSPLRLFQQILAATADEAFGPHRRRLVKLADSGGTLPRLLPFLDPSQAIQAEEAVGKAGALDDYQREALRNAVHLRFPELRQVEQPLYATPEAIAARREELRNLLETEIPTNRKAIEEARALGDLRENFEYKSSRQRHEYLAARAAALHRDLGRARPLDPAKVDASAVRVGTRLRLEGPAGEERWLTVLGPWDSEPEKGVLSNESDLAAAMLGKGPGEQVRMEGKDFRIAEIRPWR